MQAYVAAFRETLAILGWSEGRNLRLDVRFGENDVNRLRAQAAEIIKFAPHVIMTSSGAATEAMRQKTQTIQSSSTDCALSIAATGMAQSVLTHDGGRFRNKV